MIEPEEDAPSFPHGVGTLVMLVNFPGITDDAECDEVVRRLRLPTVPRCPRRDSAEGVKQGRDDTERGR